MIIRYVIKGSDHEGPKPRCRRCRLKVPEHPRGWTVDITTKPCSRMRGMEIQRSTEEGYVWWCPACSEQLPPLNG